MLYMLRDGTEVTADQIKEAFQANKAVVVHSHGEHHTKSSLMLDGEHFDTRGERYSVWEEMWTDTPNSIQQALGLARVWVWV